MKYWGIFLSMIMLVAIVILITMFGVSSLGVLDMNTNMSSSPYHDQWNLSTSTAITSISIMQMIPYLLIIGIIVLTITFFMMSFRRGRGGYF